MTIYAGGDAWNSPIIYEAPGTGLQIRRISRYLGSEYKPIRRESLSTYDIVLDNPTAKSVGGSGRGGQLDPLHECGGYFGDDYQVHAATTASAWARWTPRFPSTGNYEIYLRWTAGDRPRLGGPRDGQHPGRSLQPLHQPADQRLALVLIWARTRSSPATLRAPAASPCTRPGPTAT